MELETAALRVVEARHDSAAHLEGLDLAAEFYPPFKVVEIWCDDALDYIPGRLRRFHIASGMRAGVEVVQFECLKIATDPLRDVRQGHRLEQAVSDPPGVRTKIRVRLQ
jgi:hypothetical protein